MCFNHRLHRLLPRGVQVSLGRICLPYRLARDRAVIFRLRNDCVLLDAHLLGNGKFRCFNKRLSKIFFYGKFHFRRVIDSQVFFSIAGTFRNYSDFHRLETYGL